MNYHSKRPPVEDCPQKDGREIKPEDVVQARPCDEGTPHSLKFGQATLEWQAKVGKWMEETP